MSYIDILSKIYNYANGPLNTFHSYACIESLHQLLNWFIRCVDGNKLMPLLKFIVKSIYINNKAEGYLFFQSYSAN